MRVDVLTSIVYEDDDRIVHGGAERYLAAFVRLLRDLGADVTCWQVATRPHPVREFAGAPLHTIAQERDEGETYSTHVGLNHAFYELSARADLRVYFASFLAWPLVRRPALAICHGVYWDFYDHAFAYAPADYRAEWWRRVREAFEAPDLVVAVDQNTKNVLQASYPNLAPRIRVIPNFVDPGEFCPREAPRDWERPRVLVPRRLHKVRGINEVIRAIQDLREVDWWVCGQAINAAAEHEFGQWAAERGNVQAFWCPAAEMPAVYRDTDLVVIPTRGGEGTSLACLEAMATGLPIVGTNAGGLAQLLIDGYNATVVDLDHDDLAPAVAALLGDPERAARYGERNRALAVEAFSLERWRARWEAVLRGFWR